MLQRVSASRQQKWVSLAYRVRGKKSPDTKLNKFKCFVIIATEHVLRLAEYAFWYWNIIKIPLSDAREMLNADEKTGISAEDCSKTPLTLTNLMKDCDLVITHAMEGFMWQLYPEILKNHKDLCPLLLKPCSKIRNF